MSLKTADFVRIKLCKSAWDKIALRKKANYLEEAALKEMEGRDIFQMLLDEVEELRNGPPDKEAEFRHILMAVMFIIFVFVSGIMFGRINA